ncbi:MAG: efflux RND transporter periplasmic adaptor subunit [Planctomycetes bacterium]|nr:efflux RND transporter periplasmic adaptor subunit [Planctomycetota bacterium]
MNKLKIIIYRWGRRALKLLALGVVIAGTIYWLKFAPIQVATHLVERGPLVVEVMGTGTLEARVEATISPKISNRIEKILVDQGEHVSTGDLLVQLDDDELQQQVAIAQANVDAAAAAIHRLSTDKNRATAVFTQAQKNHARIQRLVPSNAATQGEADKATESLALAIAGIASAEASITEGQKERITAEKTLQYHRARLADTEIKAPFDGLVVKRNREPGDVVVPGSSILTLISMKELWISAWIDETEMAKLAEQQTARIVFRSEPEHSYPGTVVRLGKEADRETREFIVDVSLLELAKNWAIGQRAEVFIEVARKDEVTRLPAKLIATRNDEVGVFVNEEENARWRPITIGLHSRNFVEITSGLQPEEVVVTPQDERATLSNGRKITLP